jgi:hypothetical protein
MYGTRNTVATTATSIPTGRDRKRCSAMSAMEIRLCRVAYVQMAGPATYATASPTVR